MILELPEPHINQTKILEDESRFKVVMCGRRFGKSELAQIDIITKALEGKFVAYITPTYFLATKFFSRLINSLPFASNKNGLLINFPNNGMIQFFTGERLDNLRGQKFHHVVVDEAAYISNLEEGWINAIRPTLTDYKGSALFLSTPKGRNFFYSLYLKGISNEKDWSSYKFTSYDNPYIEKSEIDEARNQMPLPAFEQEYLANPSENSANPFGISNIRQCIYPMSNESPIVFGIDLAKSYDWTVITGLDRYGCVCHFERFQKDWKSTKEQILKLKELNVPILIDSTGVGDPIFEDLLNQGMNIQGQKFTSSSKQQLMEGLASAIHQRKLQIPSGIIVEELEIFEYIYTQNGVKYSAPQGFHDDCVMSLSLAWKTFAMNNSFGRYSFA